MSYAKVSRLYLNSDNSSSQINSFNFQVNLSSQVEQPASCTLTKCIIPNVLNSLPDYESVFYIYDSALRVCPIPNGIFGSVDDFISALNTGVQAVAGPYYAFTFSSATARITLTNSANISFQICSVANIIAYPKNIAYRCGFISQTDEASVSDGNNQQVVVATQFPKVIRSTCFYVASSLNSVDSLASNGERTIVAMIPNTARAFGDLIIFVNQLDMPSIETSSLGGYISLIHLNILDDNLQQITDDIQNANVQLEFLFHYGKSFENYD